MAWEIDRCHGKETGVQPLKRYPLPFRKKADKTGGSFLEIGGFFPERKWVPFQTFFGGYSLSQLGLLSQKRFGPFFATQFLGAFNDNLLKNALVILVTYKSVAVFGVPPAEMVPVAGGIFILPF